jgi:HD-GYP domain-containing protein (c-di-GMP phosphodiesterase class II)
VVERIDLFLAKKRLAGGLFRRDVDDADRVRPQADQRSATMSEQDESDGVAAAVADPPRAAGRVGGRAVDVCRLRPNRRLRENIYDPQGVLLLAAGHIITPSFLEKITARGITRVVLDAGSGPAAVHTRELVRQAERRRRQVHGKSDRPELIGPAARKLERLIEFTGVPAMRPNPQRPAVSRRLPADELRERASAGVEQTRLAAARHGQLAADLLRGRPMHAAGCRDLLHDLFQVVDADDSLPMLVMDLRRTDGDEYLFQHGVNAALLAMGMARSLCLHHAQVIDVGLGTLLHDVGMLRLPQAVRHADRLQRAERKLIERHPIDTIELLSPVHALGDQVQLIAYQIHERCNGGGYPRCRTIETIHPLSRIAAVADTFTAMVVDRPYRRALSPYEAVTRLLYQGRDGLYDRTVLRALLNVTSLFPVGSYVELSDGSLAKVLRANGMDHTRPVVVPLSEDGRASGDELDLSKARGVRVARALTDLSRVGAGAGGDEAPVLRVA